ncbi:MAG: hypothetical protein ISR76_06340 [Planctomycetes bacterium]|nr:hypothetical protein [Planctomycetota bacterium]MBL7008599.1 hypothetical protein [Planctomycetota bacterium]
MSAALLALPGAPLLHARPPAAAVLQDGQRSGQGQGFEWTAPDGLADLAVRYQEQIAGILGEARLWTGLPADPRPFRVEWVGDRKDLARALRMPEVPGWYAAVAVPSERRLIIATEIAGSEARLISTLRHEVMHLAMADIGPAGWARLPAWFHEGCAQVFAGEVYLGELGVSLSWRAVLGDLDLLMEYRDGFPESSAGAAVGYALGERFVSTFLRHHNLLDLKDVLAQVRSGESFDRALIEVTGMGLVEHEERMRKELVNASGLLGDIYPQIFLGLALFMVLMLPLVRAARRRRREELEERWERQDRVEDLDPVLATGQWQRVEIRQGASADEAEPWEDWDDEEF